MLELDLVYTALSQTVISPVGEACAIAETYNELNALNNSFFQYTQEPIVPFYILHDIDLILKLYHL